MSRTLGQFKIRALLGMGFVSLTLVYFASLFRDATIGNDGVLSIEIALMSNRTRSRPLCTVDDIVHGLWMTNQTLASVDEMRARYGLTVSLAVDRSCEPRESSLNLPGVAGFSMLFPASLSNQM